MDDYDDDDDVGYYDYDEDDYVSAGECMEYLCELQRGEKDHMESSRSAYLRRLCWTYDSLHDRRIFSSDKPFINYQLWEKVHNFSLFRRMVHSDIEITDMGRDTHYSPATHNPYGVRRSRPYSSMFRGYSDTRIANNRAVAQLKLKVWYET